MRAMKAAASAAILALLVAGPPWLLARIVGNPWPAEGVALDAPLTDDAIIGLLAVLLWVLWLQFAVCVAAEAAAVLTNDRVRSRVPMAFAFQQHLARRLVGGIVIATMTTPILGSGGAAAHPQGHTIAVHPDTTERPTLSIAGADRPQGKTAPEGRASTPTASEDQPRGSASDRRTSTHRTITVMRLETLWSIAERELGDGERWTEIAQLNEGRTMSDGTTFVSADHIRPGWRLLVPSQGGAVGPHQGSVEVRTGDSLSRIAQRDLGAAASWPQIYDLNRETIGSDADLIHPGQVLQLPAVGHATSPGPASPPAADRSHSDDHRTPAPWTAGSDDRQFGDEARPRVPADFIPDATERGPGSDRQGQSQSSKAETSGSDVTLLRGLLATAVCLAAGSLALLLNNRRRQFRNRRPGRTVHAVPSELKKGERAVYEAGSAAEPTARFVDLALRQLAADSRSTGEMLPRLGVAVLDADHLTLIFTEPAPSDAVAPWTGTPDGLVWSVPRTAELADSLLDQPAPYPALVTFAEDVAGRTWLLDLESVGEISVGGEVNRARDLARFIVAELAVNAWAEGVEVLLADELAIELVGLNPMRVRRCGHATAVRRAQAAATGDEQAGRLLDRRRDDDAVDGTSPLVLVRGSGAPGAGGLDCRPRCGQVAIRLLDPAQEGFTDNPTLTVGSGGHLLLAGFSDELVPFGLPAAVASDMARLMASTRTVEDGPMPESRLSSTTGQLTTADGALRLELTTPRDPEGDETSLLPASDEDYLEQTATAEADLAAIAPGVTDEVRRQVEALDPKLDADIQDWVDPESRRPKIRVLGPVDVSATSGDREHIANIGGTVEFIVYLACHEHGVTKDRAAEDLGWSGSTVQNRARDARRVLGQRPDGREWLPDAAKSGSAKRRGVAAYELDPDVLVDADLFRRLRTRAASRGPEGLEDLVVGLSLVQGEPFDQLRRGGYGWLLEGDRLDHHMCASIADAAHLVVDRALVDSDLELAWTACRIGMLVNPHSDVALLDSAALAEAEGRSPDDVVREHVVDREDEDLPHRTDQVLKRRKWLAS